MSLRSFAFAMFVGLAVVGCGPSAAQVKTARTARYQTTASAVFSAGVTALKQENYKVAQVDPVASRAVTEPRWYEVDGTSMSRDSDGRPQLTSAGGIMLSIEFGVVADGSQFRAEFIPHVLEQRNGLSAPLEIKPDDPAMPGWVSGKLDNLYLGTYDALKQHAVATP